MLFNKARVSTFSMSFQHHTGEVDALRQEKREKANRKEDMRLSFFAHNTIVYVENPRWEEGRDVTGN